MNEVKVTVLEFADAMIQSELIHEIIAKAMAVGVLNYRDISSNMDEEDNGNLLRVAKLNMESLQKTLDINVPVYDMLKEQDLLTDEQYQSLIGINEKARTVLTKYSSEVDNIDQTLPTEEYTTALNELCARAFTEWLPVDEKVAELDFALKEALMHTTRVLHRQGKLSGLLVAVGLTEAEIDEISAAFIASEEFTQE